MNFSKKGCFLYLILCQLVILSGRKRVGDDIIESLENAFGLPRMWIDMNSDEEIFATRNKQKQKIMDSLLVYLTVYSTRATKDFTYPHSSAPNATGYDQ